MDQCIYNLPNPYLPLKSVFCFFVAFAFLTCFCKTGLTVSAETIPSYSVIGHE
ncbi:MAG: hypothetical protein P857_185 [Candidatus Xenolissoclinum pacificiensis L6]|uniref:Uncharacterized protein n=1 Tax=Candidatus Xenolissoclinum pacificiensis L6 TaxID=1401685 RepID=W2V1J3_9RICK|nr:MAG: hypothetical protein P857_185 [Candidatus Xenolissoclinum pacificiensis L6]